MNKRKAFIFFAVLLTLTTQMGFSLDARLVSAEIFMTIRSDAKAVISHALVWDVRSGTMGGFYFQGEEAPFVWDTERCWADLQDGSRSKLDIKKLEGKWDILLAGGKRTAGKATWVLTYGANLATAGMFGTTTAENGERLFYFHWAPTRWDNEMDHRTVTIILPNGQVPYLYSVILTKGKGTSWSKAAAFRAHGYEVEAGGDENYGTVVIRQKTSSGGYHTKPDDCRRLLDTTLKALKTVAS